MENLEDLTNLDWFRVMERLKGFATSETSKELLGHLKPLGSSDEAKRSFNEIEEARKVLESGRRPYMESLDLFATWFSRLEKQATLKPLEIKDVRHFCIETIALDEILRDFSTPWLASVRQRLMTATEVLSAIDQILSPDGEILRDASETLFRLSQERDTCVRSVQQTLDRLVKAHEIEGLLQDRYVTNREGRWVLPIKSGMQHSFDGIIHASSQSKQTVFMEPADVIPLNNRVRQLDAEMEQEIERLLVQLSEYLHGQYQNFERTRQTLAEMDIRLAEAQLAVALRAQSCHFSSGRIHLKRLRHPVLSLSHQEVVSNDVELDQDRRILLLSGPNAGGKTVLLKAVGLAAQMARCGLPICAEPDSRIPFFAGVTIAVGDSQSVDAHLSTFAAHLKILDAASQVTGPTQLLLIDEICGSTDPEEGAALARSFISRYSANRVFAVITSHLGALKKGWGDDSGVINGSLEFDQETGPTYRFLMGVPGQSLAIQTARRVGVSSGIVEAALGFLSPDQKKYHQGLKEVEALHEEISLMRKELARERQETEKERARYERLAEKFQKDRDYMLERAVQRAEKRIDEYIEKAKAEEIFRRHDQRQRLKEELPELIKTSPTSAAPFQFKTNEDFGRAFPPGSRVFVPTINQDAVIQSQPNGKGEVAILAGSMHLLVPWQTLMPPQKAPNPTHEVIRRSQFFSIAPVEADRSVDVRGKSIEEAIGLLEIQLDTAALSGEDRLKVIHGHGTEALKKAIRAHLSRSLYVKKWLAGTADTGGEGVTWVEIKD